MARRRSFTSQLTEAPFLRGFLSFLGVRVEPWVKDLASLCGAIGPALPSGVGSAR